MLGVPFAFAPKIEDPDVAPPGIVMPPMNGDGTPVAGVIGIGNPVTPVTTGIGEHGGNAGGIGMKGRVGTAHRLDC